MKTILLVEDNDMNRDMLSRRLSRKGFVVVMAVTGEEALEKARSNCPALILMDLTLPGISGLEATQQLKAENCTREIPIIALTANAMASDMEKALTAGCDDFLVKPVDFVRLSAIIDKYIDEGDSG